ncbi:MAG: cytochrome c [Candidatus Devosia phytovorans]|uniref:Cytochrome c n=1 Tax=Candidatus Devosia phytovorans TaxID=3121372 RepID=A0AAJ5VR44_9HYPH|nr:cytochrome c [Devosia sp.]WEK02712.1 MAG: cytochrome c [Devosia sp.]
MSIKKISAMAIAGLMTLGVVATVAQDAFVAPATPEEAVTARKAIMRTNGQTLRSAGPLTGAEAVAAMQTLLDDYTNMPALFPEGSIVGDSEALPAIWENWEGFTAIIETGRAAAETGLAAAETGDAAGYAAALQAIGATCGQCHQQFRS